ncbi:MAG: hypothetical protein AAF485_15075 [Chloroflexota bacterium]
MGFFIGIGLIVLWGSTLFLLRRRTHRKLAEENKIRQSLGLPALSLSEYNRPIPEGERDYCRDLRFQ